MFHTKELVTTLHEGLFDLADKNRIDAMERYMKNHFSFIGVSSPVRRNFQRSVLSKIPKDLIKEHKWEFVNELWLKDQREFQYVAMDYLNSWNSKFIEKEDIAQIEWLLKNKSWWDSVDNIASNFLGKYFKKFPEMIQPTVEKWLESNNIWLQRSCLIFQLKYGLSTDFELLKRIIVFLLPINEFFIQKAIGWSLRQYSKCNVEKVRLFIENIPIKGLALREAKKYL